MDYSGDDVRLLRLVRTQNARTLRQIDVARAMDPPVSRQWVAQIERRHRLSSELFRRVAAAILAASR